MFLSNAIVPGPRVIRGALFQPLPVHFRAAHLAPPIVRYVEQAAQSDVYQHAHKVRKRDVPGEVWSLSLKMSPPL